MTVGAHIIVRGMVQGVGFRFFVFHRATRLGLSGFARNNHDGSVDIEVHGDRSAIESLLEDVRIGPRAASVTGVTLDWKKAELHYTHFEIR